MSRPKIHGPCVLEGCESHDPFRKFTEAAKCSSIINKTYETYNYLQVGDQLCHLHYLSIVVPDRGGKNAVKKQISGEFGEIHII
ncbi:13443_t:CDS:2 [Entrophospora sp. SA101]|nr:13443_t:CDS:2 [Entrophospora sp. SA101]